MGPRLPSLALRVFDADPKNFGPAQKLVESLLESGQGDRAMAVLDQHAHSA